jgi:hypothetical protein
MKTLQVERSLSSRAKHLQYDGGYLFVSKTKNLVRILDVESGTFLRDLCIKIFLNSDMIFRANSNNVVIANIDSKFEMPPILLIISLIMTELIAILKCSV